MAGTVNKSAETKSPAELQAEILDLVARYAAFVQAPAPFVPGKTAIPASGKVLGIAELQKLVEPSLDGWLTTGRFNDAFEPRLPTHAAG